MTRPASSSSNNSFKPKPLRGSAKFRRKAPRASRIKARVTVITLGVDDLGRALSFYRDGLGLSTDGIIGKEFEHGAVAFFNLQPSLELAIWPRKSISHDSGLPHPNAETSALDS